MHTVADVSEPCLPLPPEMLLLTLGEALDKVDELLATLPQLFASSKRPDAALGAGLQAGTLLLEKSGGRLLVFQHTLPTVGPLKLQQRDDVRVYGTDKERALLGPLDSPSSGVAPSCGMRSQALPLLELLPRHGNMAAVLA